MHTHSHSGNATLRDVFVIAADDLTTAFMNFELSVFHVSRRWRAVSLSMQELWGKLSIKMHLDRVWIYLDRTDC
jgi:hypothetical protein